MACRRQEFTVSELKRLVRELDRVGQDFRPIYYIMGQLYASVGYALRQNEKYLLGGPTHSIVDSLRSLRKTVRRLLHSNGNDCSARLLSVVTDTERHITSPRE